MNTASTPCRKQQLRAVLKCGEFKVNEIVIVGIGIHKSIIKHWPLSKDLFLNEMTFVCYITSRLGLQ